LSANQTGSFSQHLGAFSSDGERNLNVDLEQWARTSCLPVPPYLWQTTSAPPNAYPQNNLLLYDCAK
ncbi:MAG TPA: hypothetical protein VGN34_32990, partial [Ktedonobacteraceae bacterium]